MTITRKINNKVDIKPREVIISHIDRAFVEIHDAFSIAFSGGQANPQGIDAQRKALFDYIWHGLSVLDISTFHSIEELNGYYWAYINNLENIKDYYRIENFSDDVVAQNKIDVLKVAAKIYYALAKQQYILRLYRQDDEINILLPQLELVNSTSEIIEKKSLAIDINEIEKTLVYINVVFNEIVTGIKLKGFGSVKIDASLSDLPKHNHIDVLKIRESLNLIPSANETHQWIARLIAAQESGYKDEIKHCKDKLKEIIQVTENVLNCLGEVISSDLKLRANNLHILLQECDVLDKELLVLNEDFKKLDAFPLLIQLYMKNNHLEVSGSYSELISLAKQLDGLCGAQTIFDINLRIGNQKYWESAKATVNDSLPQIARELSEFVRPYIQSIKLYQGLCLRVSRLNEKKNKVDTLRVLWDARLQKAENAWQACSEAMYHAQDVLMTYTESNVDYVKSFFSRHKFKMLFGSVGGSGTGVTLSALLFAFELTATGVLVGTGTLFGVVIAALTGFGLDYYKNAQPGNEDKPLSRLDHSGRNTSVFSDIAYKSEVDPSLTDPSILTRHSLWSHIPFVDKVPNLSMSKQSSEIDVPKLTK